MCCVSCVLSLHPLRTPFPPPCAVEGKSSSAELAQLLSKEIVTALKSGEFLVCLGMKEK